MNSYLHYNNPFNNFIFYSYKVIIITPILFGSGTGAATYYYLLAEGLQHQGIDLTIISEKANLPINFDNGEYLGLFPSRTGKKKQLIRDLIGYAWQNLQYLKLPSIVQKKQSNAVLVHTSFYNLPGIFPQVMKRAIAQKQSKQKYIADVRDVLLPLKQVKYLSQYDQVIACSENVRQLLISGGLNQEKITYIPIPQETISVNSVEVENLLTELGLDQTPYIFYAGMIKEIKAIDLLLETFTQFVHPKQPDIKLVLAGYIKTTNPKILNLLQSENVHYVGNRNRKDILNLMAGASLCINLSPNESIGRSSLEALALKRPTLLPPNIPEFMCHCPDFVVSSRDPQVIAEQIIDTLSKQKIPTYPIEQHLPEKVIQQYHTILR
ncbi:glycosyltransferase family 4 protein [Euhalothece natronophila Z-M001]|uniref:Glycosyltransferase family 4 protein n=1 Tax=Euhalothece natronophila Z-M001 TaxID=522448 RepID=A0A5B8NNS0_9CHRO|nr:glycosyltransferase family 4 protein [Euhalothece natronophila]QDZ40714.1 glycosyltransferase family 4 protein [Euhalothece natronophila Z-M001]